MDYVDAHLDARSRWLSWLAWRRCPPITSHACSIPPSANRRTPGARAPDRARKALLAAGKSDLASIAQASGFGSASHLSRVFRDAAGVTPGQYRGARAGR